MSSNADRAQAAYVAMQRYFYLNDGTSLYRESYPTSERRFSYCWPFAEALRGTLDLFTLDRTTYDVEVNDRLTGLARYWVGTPARPGYDSYPPLDGGGDQYFDDNVVIAQALVRLHRMRGDDLARAAEIFRFITSRGGAGSWPDRPGGIFWVDTAANRDRGTYCSMAAASLGRQLAALGRTDQDYRGWASRLQAWVDAHLYDALDGLCADKILGSDGSLDSTRWSYNQGAAIDACTLSYLSSRAVTDLQRAERLTDAGLAYFGARDRFAAQPAIFNAIFFRNALPLAPLTHGARRQRIRNAMQSYADSAWREFRAPNGLFSFDRSRNAYELLDQAAMVQIYALLASAPGPSLS